MSIDIAEQYDKIYRYCCYRLHRREDRKSTRLNSSH